MRWLIGLLLSASIIAAAHAAGFGFIGGGFDAGLLLLIDGSSVVLDNGAGASLTAN